jgi:hypothetical protein
VNRELRDIGRAVGQEDRLGKKPFNSLLAISVGWLIVVPPFVSFYRTFQRIEAAQEIAGTGVRVNVWLGFILYILDVLLLPVEIIYAQSELNRGWNAETKRAATPGVAVTDPTMSPA